MKRKCPAVFIPRGTYVCSCQTILTFFSSHTHFSAVFILYFNPHILRRKTHHKRYLYSLLGPGCLAAHRRSCLVLLHSWPDTVHRGLLRKTQTSTPLIKGSFTVCNPRQDITPAIADCRYRTPLTPRLCGNFMTRSYLNSIPRRTLFVKQFSQAPGLLSAPAASAAFPASPSHEAP